MSFLTEMLHAAVPYGFQAADNSMILRQCTPEVPLAVWSYCLFMPYNVRVSSAMQMIHRNCIDAHIVDLSGRAQASLWEPHQGGHACIRRS